MAMPFLNNAVSLTLMFAALLVFAIAYRFYGVFMAYWVLRPNTKNATPATVLADGRDYVATHKNVLFGHHFAAVAAAGAIGVAGACRLAWCAVDTHRVRTGRWRARYGSTVCLCARRGTEPSDHCQTEAIGPLKVLPLLTRME